MSAYKYRPIVDLWILARTKSHYYGGYPEGFLWRAKQFCQGKTLHMCSGKIRLDGDVSIDINPKVKPDVVGDATNTDFKDNEFDSVMIDPPYSEEEAKNYGYDYPRPIDLLREAVRVVKIGGKVGILHWLIPKPPKELKFVGVIGVFCGYNNRIRAFSVFEKEVLK